MKGPIKAAELKAQLAKDPDYQERMRIKRQEQEEYHRTLDFDENELVAELRVAGRSLSSVWDLVNTKESYPELFPILLRHLQVEHLPRIRKES